MASKIFVNLPVKDLNRSVEFFTKLGFSFNPQFTDDRATCMVVSDDIYVMLLVESFFKSFTKKEIPDPATSSEVIVTLSAETRDEVDELANKAVEAGATIAYELTEEKDMYCRCFRDPDGHLWERMYMDLGAMGMQ